MGCGKTSILVQPSGALKCASASSCSKAAGGGSGGPLGATPGRTGAAAEPGLGAERRATHRTAAASGAELKIGAAVASGAELKIGAALPHPRQRLSSIRE